MVGSRVRNSIISGSAPKLAEKSQGCLVSTDRFAGKRRCGGALSCHPIPRRHLPTLRRRAFRPDRVRPLPRTRLPSLVPQKRWRWRSLFLLSPLHDKSVAGRRLASNSATDVLRVGLPFRFWVLIYYIQLQMRMERSSELRRPPAISRPP